MLFFYRQWHGEYSIWISEMRFQYRGNILWRLHWMPRICHWLHLASTLWLWRRVAFVFLVSQNDVHDDDGRAGAAVATNLFSSHFAFQLILFIRMWFIFCPSRASIHQSIHPSNAPDTPNWMHAVPPQWYLHSKRTESSSSTSSNWALSNGNSLDGHIQIFLGEFRRRGSGHSFHTIENPLDSIWKHTWGGSANPFIEIVLSIPFYWCGTLLVFVVTWRDFCGGIEDIAQEPPSSYTSPRDGEEVVAEQEEIIENAVSQWDGFLCRTHKEQYLRVILLLDVDTFHYIKDRQWTIEWSNGFTRVAQILPFFHFHEQPARIVMGKAHRRREIGRSHDDKDDIGIET